MISMAWFFVRDFLWSGFLVHFLVRYGLLECFKSQSDKKHSNPVRSEFLKTVRSRISYIFFWNSDHKTESEISDRKSGPGSEIESALILVTVQLIMIPRSFEVNSWDFRFVNSLMFERENVCKLIIDFWITLFE